MQKYRDISLKGGFLPHATLYFVEISFSRDEDFILVRHMFSMKLSMYVLCCCHCAVIPKFDPSTSHCGLHMCC